MKDWKKEPRFMLDKDSICYGCDYYIDRMIVLRWCAYGEE